MKVTKVLLGLAVLTLLFTITARADEVSDWNRNLFEAARLNVPPTSPLVVTRNAAIVQAAVFDALNGIERRYTSIHVEPAAARGASRRAAVILIGWRTSWRTNDDHRSRQRPPTRIRPTRSSRPYRRKQCGAGA